MTVDAAVATPTVKSKPQVWHISALVLACSIWAATGWSAWVQTSGIAPDSVSYLDAAKRFHDGLGLTHRWAYWDPIYVTGTLPTRTSMWPAGLSLTLTAAMYAGVDPVLAGRLVSFLSFALITLLIYWWSRRFLRLTEAATSAVMAATLLTATLFPLGVATVTSELPFLCMATVAAYLSMNALLKSGGRGAVPYWVAASACAGCAFLYRYVGIAAVGSVGLLAAFDALRRQRHRVTTLLAGSAPGGAIVLATMTRNWVVSGTPGQPWPGAHIFWTTLPDTLRALALGQVGRGVTFQGPLAILVLVRVGVLVTLSALAVRSYLRSRHASARPDDRPRLVGSAVLLTNIVLCALITLLATASNGMDVEPRYLGVLGAWCVAVILAWAFRAPQGSAGPGTSLPLALCLTWMLTEVVAGAALVNRPFTNYVDAGAASGAVQWVRDNVGPSEVVLTNRGADIAFWTPNPVVRLPRRPHSAQGVSSMDGVDRVASMFHARYLVHFKKFPESAKYNRSEFEFLRQMDDPSRFRDRVVAEFPDAIVYRTGPGWATRRP
jgi:hypothetical protein